MAFSRADFVQQTTNTTGTGTYSLSGSVGGRQNFLDGNASGSTVRYSVTDGTNWEVAEGILTSGQVTRATVIASSNSGAAISWSAGDKFISQVLTASEVNDLATESYVDSAVAGIVDSAPAALDTLNELAAALGDDPNFATTTATSIGEKLAKASNLSDLANAATARTNLGLGTAATTNSTAYATSAQGTLADSALQSNQTITLSGDASGSGTTSITVTVADDSHNHIISNVDGLQTALDGKVDDSQVLTNVPSGAVFTDTTYSVGNGGLTEINFTSALNSKLAGIEASATADQTASEILTAIKTVDGSGSGLDADLLDGQEGTYYAAASSLSNYLPLTGGTLTGNLIVDINGTAAGLVVNSNTGTNPNAATIDLIETNVNPPTFGSGSNGFRIAYNGDVNRLEAISYTLSGNEQRLRFAIDRSSGDASFYADDGTTQDFYWDASASSLGIGTTSPATALDVSGVVTATGGNSTNWNTAYSWGNHASAGYAAASSLSNYLPKANNSDYQLKVWDNRSTDTSTDLGSQAAVFEFKANSTDSLSDGGTYHGVLTLQQWSDTSGGNTHQLAFTDNGNLHLRSVAIGGTWPTNWSKIWHSGNDGSGSGLDADLLDGQQGSYYVNTSTAQTISGIKSFNSETKFGSSYVDPDSGVARDAKFGTNGIAVSGGIKTDTLKVVSPDAQIILSDETGTPADQSIRLRHEPINTNNPNSVPNALWLEDASATQVDPCTLVVEAEIYANGSNKVWHSGNDGAGSGLDADLLDGQQGSYYLNTSTNHGGDITGAYNNLQIAANVVGANELNVSGNGTSGQVLSSDGDGSMTWTTPSSGGGVTTGKAIAMAIVFG